MILEILVVVIACLMFLCFAALMSMGTTGPVRIKSTTYLMGASTLLCFGVNVRLLCYDYADLVFLSNLSTALFVIILTCFVAFVLEFTKMFGSHQRIIFAILCTVPLATVFALITDPWFHFYNSSSESVGINSFGIAIIATQPGLFNWIWSFYSWPIAFVFVYFFLRHIYLKGEKNVALLLSIVVIVAGVSNAAAYFIPMFANLSIDGLSFVISILIFYYMAAYFGLFNLVVAGRRKMLDIMDEYVVVVDSNGIIEDVNKACEEYLGAEQSDVIGLPFFKVFSPLQDLLLLAINGTGNKGPVEIVDPGGTILEARIIEFEYGHSAKFGKMITLRDIMDRKALEETAKQAKAEQEQFKAQRIESLGLLAGGIAHDFNNTLSSIVSNLEVVKAQTGGGGEVAWRLSKVEKAAMNARSLSDQLLTFSKGGKPIRSHVNIAETVRSTTLFALSGSNVRPVFSIVPGPLNALADPVQLEQVISNLVINAKQAMPKGGKLEVAARALEVSDHSELPLRPGKYVMMEFKDQGIGISPDNISKIFDPFFTTKPDGKGLGLTTALSIIRNHDGEILVQSAVGTGTSMTVFIPEIQVDAETPSETPVIQDSRHTGRILIMDDEEEIVEVLGQLLEGSGYNVEATRSGEEAVAAYRAALVDGRKFDLVIMDLTIKGGMGGKEAIEVIAGIDPSVKAVVSSGYSMDPVMADPQKYGFCMVLPKPYTLVELRDAVRKAIECGPIEHHGQATHGLAESA
ncbi:MAG TPA: ATP-binding protein [Methanomassiliicoccales archaeon]|nr:ATP-binding protein [Methanomassiliicoccales archaeon]